MSKRDNGGPAFPRPHSTDEHAQPCNGFTEQDGMTLRDWFAGKALAGLLTKIPLVDQQGIYGESVPDKIQHNKDIAESCYWISDAMLEARGKV